MRVRVSTTALGVAAVLLALPSCSTDTTGVKYQTAPSARTGKPAALSSAALEPRLLDESDLGGGYLRKPERPTQHDDVTVIGCPALSKLGGGTATGGTLTFPHMAKVTFTYGGGSSEISEELYSDSAKKLSGGISRIFDAMTGCPTYQVVAGGASVGIASQKLPTPHDLGDERWSQFLTFSAGGRSTVVKQTAIRDGNLLLIVSGSPALVDRHLAAALDKATATS
ncbi:hypothetical protein [Streptomyces paludis]|uniref:Sensor domain-containing protein n=1 Tax=Streptomyces paludis TaxID=2282738 RepID=A0A345HVU3_9ACTN|nr:hypothetical protein [Streptomyces paludis]AXG80817.1 hypothetical protein DVK44_27610 [Streptomyces paludis]